MKSKHKKTGDVKRTIVNFWRAILSKYFNAGKEHATACKTEEKEKSKNSIEKIEKHLSEGGHYYGIRLIDVGDKALEESDTKKLIEKFKDTPIEKYEHIYNAWNDEDAALICLITALFIAKTKMNLKLGPCGPICQLLKDLEERNKKAKEIDVLEEEIEALHSKLTDCQNEASAYDSIVEESSGENPGQMVKLRVHEGNVVKKIASLQTKIEQKETLFHNHIEEYPLHLSADHVNTEGEKEFKLSEKIALGLKAINEIFENDLSMVQFMLKMSHKDEYSYPISMVMRELLYSSIDRQTFEDDELFSFAKADILEAISKGEDIDLFAVNKFLMDIGLSIPMYVTLHQNQALDFSDKRNHGTKVKNIAFLLHKNGYSIASDKVFH